MTLLEEFRMGVTNIDGSVGGEKRIIKERKNTEETAEMMEWMKKLRRRKRRLRKTQEKETDKT
jgi:hypothetical protein